MILNSAWRVRGRLVALAIAAFSTVTLLALSAGLTAEIDDSDLLPVHPVKIPAAPPGPTILTVETPSGPRTYDRAALETLDTYVLNAKLIWEEENGQYQGVLLSDVLAHAGIADVASVRVSALDGYSAMIPREDWTRWPLLLATRQHGRRWRCATRGHCASFIRYRRT